jgi:hypothetical protein
MILRLKRKEVFFAFSEKGRASQSSSGKFQEVKLPFKYYG